MTTACATPGTLSPCMLVVVLSSAPVAMNTMRLSRPAAISGKQMGAKHTRRTPAAASTGMRILSFRKDFASAVKQFIFVHVDLLCVQQLNQQLTPQMSQIARNDQIIVRKSAAHIAKMRRKRFTSGRRHRRAHVVRIRNSQIDHAPAGRMGQNQLWPDRRCRRSQPSPPPRL